MEVPDVVVSATAAEDADAALDAARTTYAEGLRTARGLPEAEAAARARDDVARLLPRGTGTAGHLFLTARSADAVLGHAWVAVQGPDAAGTAWLYALWVAPAARRRGIGRRLVLAAADAARAHGAQRLGLNVFGGSRGAIALYEDVGFAVTAQQMALPL